MDYQMLSFLRPMLLAAGVLASASGALAQNQVVDFEDLSLHPETYWNGSDRSVEGQYDENHWMGPVTFYHSDFGSNGIALANTFAEWWVDEENGQLSYTSWTGWAYSNVTDTETPGFGNQYSAYSGGGMNGSKNYAVYYGDFDDPPPTITGIPAGMLLGAYFTNTTYAALSMLEGDGLAKKFGGESGDYEDWFLLTITGLDASNESTGTVDFYLADYRNEDDVPNYIVDTWTWVDLTGLGGATQLQFELDSSDHNDHGMVTPAYFAMDNLTIVPEPSSMILLLCSAVVGMLGFGRRGRRRRGKP